MLANTLFLAVIFTFDSIQDTMSVVFPREDQIRFSITKYIQHLKL